MAVVTGFTSARMLDIENNSVVSGSISGDNLHLTTRGGSTIDAGNVRGATGSTGATGSIGPTGPQGVLAIWQALHAYTAGDWILTPLGEAVQSKTTRTSGSTFDSAEASNWKGEDQTLLFTNTGFAWGGSNASWDAGVLSVNTNTLNQSQMSSPQPTFAIPGSVSGSLKFKEIGTYDLVWYNIPGSGQEVGNAGYRVNIIGSWPGSPSAPADIVLGEAVHLNGQTYLETRINALGIRVPQVDLEIRLQGQQTNGSTNVAKVKLIKRASI